MDADCQQELAEIKKMLRQILESLKELHRAVREIPNQMNRS
jgi:hypothetical protein